MLGDKSRIGRPFRPINKKERYNYKKGVFEIKLLKRRQMKISTLAHGLFLISAPYLNAQQASQSQSTAEQEAFNLLKYKWLRAASRVN
jgi:hypothetical protein